MKYRTFFYFCIVVLFIGCERSKESPVNYNQLTFEESFNKIGEVTFKEVIFGSMRIQIYQDGYLIMDPDRERFELFSLDGEHIKTIGNEGKGPGEFVNLQAFATDASDNIFAFDAELMRFTVFDSSGNYKRSFTLKDNFRAHELKFYNRRLYAFRGYTHKGMPTYISEINPENGEIVNNFFSPPSLLDNLQIPVSGYFRNMSISDDIVTVVHPLLFQIYQFDLDGTLIRKAEGKSVIYKKPDSNYKVPAPIHNGISAIIQTNFEYDDKVVIGLSEITSQGSGDFYIELFDKIGNKINKNPINTGSNYLLYVDKQGRYYFKKENSDNPNLTTLELFKLSEFILESS